MVFPYVVGTEEADSMSKPRIKYNPDLGQWMCVGPARNGWHKIGVGSRPETAYKDWKYEVWFYERNL